jgi:hypothetical protein
MKVKPSRALRKDLQKEYIIGLHGELLFWKIGSKLKVPNGLMNLMLELILKLKHTPT